MNPEILQQFLVLAGEVSYIEQASATHTLISDFLDVCRHCDSKTLYVSLYAELAITEKFIASFKSFSPLYTDITVENSESYKGIHIRPGEAIRLLHELTQDSSTLPSGRLAYAAGKLRYLPPSQGE